MEFLESGSGRSNSVSLNRSQGEDESSITQQAEAPLLGAVSVGTSQSAAPVHSVSTSETVTLLGSVSMGGSPASAGVSIDQQRVKTTATSVRSKSMTVLSQLKSKFRCVYPKKIRRKCTENSSKNNIKIVTNRSVASRFKSSLRCFNPRKVRRECIENSSKNNVKMVKNKFRTKRSVQSNQSDAPNTSKESSNVSTSGNILRVHEEASDSSLDSSRSKECMRNSKKDWKSNESDYVQNQNSNIVEVIRPIHEEMVGVTPVRSRPIVARFRRLTSLFLRSVGKECTKNTSEQIGRMKKNKTGENLSVQSNQSDAPNDLEESSHSSSDSGIAEESMKNSKNDWAPDKSDHVENHNLHISRPTSVSISPIIRHRNQEDQNILEELENLLTSINQSPEDAAFNSIEQECEEKKETLKQLLNDVQNLQKPHRGRSISISMGSLPSSVRNMYKIENHIDVDLHQ